MKPSNTIQPKRGGLTQHPDPLVRAQKRESERNLAEARVLWRQWSRHYGGVRKPGDR